LTVLVVTCGAPPEQPTPAVARPTPTTIVVIVTVAPPGPTSAPTPVVALPSPPPAIDRVLTLVSDGLSAPLRFTLAGGDYLFAWVVPRAPNGRDCTFDALLVSEPTVSPARMQPLGPQSVIADAGLTGSRRIAGLGAGGYVLRPNGDCQWTVTITPLGSR
jgi:hypothetical protein